MPTLVRLFVFLVVLAGLGFAGMVVLTATVDPGEKDITIKIPTRELIPTSAPIDVNNLPAPVNVAPKDDSPGASSASSSASSAAPIDTVDTGASQPGVKTVDVGGE